MSNKTYEHPQGLGRSTWCFLVEPCIHSLQARALTTRNLQNVCGQSKADSPTRLKIDVLLDFHNIFFPAKIWSESPEDIPSTLQCRTRQRSLVDNHTLLLSRPIAWPARRSKKSMHVISNLVHNANYGTCGILPTKMDIAGRDRLPTFQEQSKRPDAATKLSLLSTEPHHREVTL